jgi:uncharacterized protein
MEALASVLRGLTSFLARNVLSTFCIKGREGYLVYVPVSLILLLLPLSAFSASFDCHKSHTFIEKAICADKQLSKLDEKLGQAYKMALAKTSATDEIKAGQQEWQEKVRNICQDKDCLIKVYKMRLTALDPSLTNTDKFVGTSWRPLYSSNDIVEFREGGVVAHKSIRGISYGQWKVEKGVIRFDNNNYTHYEANIDGDWLVGHLANSGANSDFRWYRADNDKINQMVKKDIDQSIEDFRNAVETARLGVLRESPEAEEMLQKDKGEQYGGKHWLNLCESSGLKMRAFQIANSQGKSESELCYNWYGTRHEWKESILKEGCLGRCRP